MDVQQSRYWIKISCSTYINRIMPKHRDSWMSDKRMPTHPTPLPVAGKFMESFMAAKGNRDKDVQAALAKEYGFSYRSGVGELIYAMITCRPDLSFAITAAAQNSAAPH